VFGCINLGGRIGEDLQDGMKRFEGMKLEISKLVGNYKTPFSTRDN